MYDDVQKTGGWIFVIDTELYAGNFERELTAYITGIAGECGVGEEMFPYYISETGDTNREKFEDLLEQRPDDHGCHRPCSIYPTPGWFNHGHGGHYRNGDEEAALKDYIKEIKQNYGTEQMGQMLKIKAILGRGEKYSNWTMKDVERDIKRLNGEVERVEKMTTVNKYPAYLSVALFFFNKPSTELIEFMKDRASKYHLVTAKENKRRGHKFSPEDLKITGFRLIKEKISMEEESV